MGCQVKGALTGYHFYGLRKKCGLTDLILSQYLPRFSLHCDRPAKESVGNSGSVFLLNCHYHDVSFVFLSNLIEVSAVYPWLVRPEKESDCIISDVHRVLNWCDGGAPFFCVKVSKLPVPPLVFFFFSSWLDLCAMTFLQGPTLSLQMVEPECVGESQKPRSGLVD